MSGVYSGTATRITINGGGVVTAAGGFRSIADRCWPSTLAAAVRLSSAAELARLPIAARFAFSPGRMLRQATPIRPSPPAHGPAAGRIRPSAARGTRAATSSPFRWSNRDVGIASFDRPVSYQRVLVSDSTTGWSSARVSWQRQPPRRCSPPRRSAAERYSLGGPLARRHRS